MYLQYNIIFIMIINKLKKKYTLLFLIVSIVFKGDKNIDKIIKKISRFHDRYLLFLYGYSVCSLALEQTSSWYHC